MDEANLDQLSPLAAGIGCPQVLVGVPVMWIELREVAWLTTVILGLSIASVSIAVGLAMFTY